MTDDARAVSASARAALAAVADVPPAEVAVVGDGALALLLRHLLATTHDGDGPAAVLETTGVAASIAAAVRDVAALGRVVLAAEPVEATVDVRTYADVHARGLTVVGVPGDAGAADRGDVEWLQAQRLG